MTGIRSGSGARRGQGRAGCCATARWIAGKTVGLDGLAGRRSAALAHGQQRAAGNCHGAGFAPETVLLLDEPLAGMGAEEGREMVAHLGRTAQQGAPSCWSSTIWTPYFQLADRISVLVRRQADRHRHPGPDPGRCACPRGLSGRGRRMSALLGRVDGSGDVLWRVPGAVRNVLRHGSEGGRHPDRPQRHGQDHHGQRRSWGSHVPCDAATIRCCMAHRISTASHRSPIAGRLGLGWCPKAARSFRT